MGETLGFAVPSKDERSDLIRRLESMPPPQDHISLSPMSFADVPKARAMLGGISIHRALATLVPLPEFFTPDIIETFGEPNGCMALAEGIDAKARSCAISGKWHSLHTSLVGTYYLCRFRSLLMKLKFSVSVAGHCSLITFSTNSVSDQKWRIPSRDGHHSSTTNWSNT